MNNRALEELKLAGGVAKLKGKHIYMLVHEVRFGTSKTADMYDRQVMALEEDGRFYHVHRGAYDVIVGEELFDFIPKGGVTKIKVNEDRLKIITSVRKSGVTTSVASANDGGAPIAGSLGECIVNARTNLRESEKALEVQGSANRAADRALADAMAMLK